MIPPPNDRAPLATHTPDRDVLALASRARVDMAVALLLAGCWLILGIHVAGLFAKWLVPMLVIGGISALLVFGWLGAIAARSGRQSALMRTASLLWRPNIFTIVIFRGTDTTCLQNAQAQADLNRGSLLRTGDDAVYFAAMPNLRTSRDVMIVADWHSFGSATTEPVIDFSVDRIEKAWMQARRPGLFRHPMTLHYSGEALAARVARIEAAVAALTGNDWLVSIETDVPMDRWSRHADPNHTVRTGTVNFSNELPVGIAANVPAYRFSLRRQFDIVFLPDRLVIDTPRMVTALDYRSLRCRVGEFDSLLPEAPRDGEVIRYEFLHAGDDGGPDPAAAPNPLLPVVRLGCIDLEDSTSGFRVVFWTSNADSAFDFRRAFSRI